jgi:Fe(3+) dicitrate transport protein
MKTNCTDERNLQRHLNRSLIPCFLFMALNSFSQETTSDTLRPYELQSITIVGEKVRTLPGAGQYIGPRKLEKLNEPNINNVLRIIPGVNIRDEEGFGLRPNIGLRGTPVNRSAKITLMEDGILIAPAPYADPAAYYFPSFQRMQGLEVLKGSSQIKYGPYTIGGAVNLLSTAIPKTFNAFAQGSYGSFGTNQQRIWVGDSHKHFDYVFEVDRMASKGFKQLDNGGGTGFDRRDFMGKLRWHNDEKAKIPQSLLLKLLNSTEDSDETYLGLSYEDYIQNPLRRYAATQLDRLDMSRQDLSLTHTILPQKGISIQTTGYYTTTYRDWARANAMGGQSIQNILNDPISRQTSYQIMTGTSNGNIDYQSAARTYSSTGIQSQAQFQFNGKRITHQLQFGFRAHADAADRFATRSVYAMRNGTMSLTQAGIKANQENQLREAKSFATYLNYDLEIGRLKLSPGIRHESIRFDFSNYGNNDVDRLGTDLKIASNELSILLPGIGFNWEMNQKMNLFGGLHKGFSPPGMPSTASTSTQAKVETSVNYEIGYRYEWNGVQIQSAVFLNDYQNILGSDNLSGGGAGTGDQFNAGKAVVGGLEFGFSYDLLYPKRKNSDLKLPVTIAYTYTHARFQETFINGGGDWGSGQINKGDLIPFITPHLLTATAGVEYKHFNATMTTRYTGETWIRPGSGHAVTPNSIVKYTDVNALRGFLIIDLSANYSFNRILTAFTTINNLTNSSAIVANLPQGYRPNMPLSVVVGAKVKLSRWG